MQTSFMDGFLYKLHVGIKVKGNVLTQWFPAFYSCGPAKFFKSVQGPATNIVAT